MDRTWRAGIGLRLSAAFLSVGILAATANLIAEHGAAIVTTSSSTVPAAMRPAPPAAAPAAVPAAAVAAAAVPIEEEARPPAADSLFAAKSRYERAFVARLSLDSAALEAERVAARVVWRRELQKFSQAAVPSASGARRRKLGAAADEFERSQVELLGLADRRREAQAGYVDGIEGLQSRVRDSLDKALKLFGRVIARQYLVKLRDDVDELRRQSLSLGSTAYTQDKLAALAAAEVAFEQTLQQNESRFAGSEGKLWYAQVQLDLKRVVSLKDTLVDTDSRRIASQAAANAAAAGLDDAIRDIATARPRAKVPLPRPEVTRVATSTSTPAPVAEVIAEEVAAAPVSITTVERIEPVKSTQRQLVAWITVAVLAVLLALCVATVRSIVLPVRKLMAATVRLARGDDCRVERGGIRELDSLAVAFNDMAEQLSVAKGVAQGYQQQLEQRVEERTRQLQHQAEHDPLTQLPNRRQLFSMLHLALDRARREGRPLGVFFIDLDNFKNINDGMGHAFGDRLLVRIAERLRETVTEWGFAARFGGDEFTVVHENATSIEEIRAAGWQLVRAFQSPLVVDDSELLISVSVGASLFPDHHDTADSLLRAADAALFRAKALGRSQLSVFTPELLEAAATRFSTEQGLRRAVERGEFELMFQPEVSTADLQTGLVEALLRWRLPDGRYAAPGEFLAVAEESGLIMEISDWVLRSAIEAAARWHHGAWPQVRVAINVSSRQLFDHRFVDRVVQLLEEFRLPARCVEIELTETVLQTGPATIETLHRLRAHGVGIALDDFGTGYSSIASLEQLPITRVKLDRSLIASIDSSPRSAAIARAIISLCHSLGLEITAEGIERPAQFAALLSQGTLYLQGYLIARPAHQHDVVPLLAEIPQRMESLLICSPVGAIAGPGTMVAAGPQALEVSR